MDVVNNRRELEANLRVLAGYRDSGRPQEREFYRKLVARGRCLVVWNAAGSLEFGPSRFVGYAGNSARAHIGSSRKDGRETNRAIERVLRYPPEQDEKLEREYFRVCGALGVRPARIERKYWSER